MARERSNWALVTGASKGIGAASAAALAGAGRDVLVHYGGDADGAAATMEACQAKGVQARAIGADLREGPDALVEAVEEVGGVHVLVNNAGINADGLTLSMPDEAIDDVLQVNVNAAFKPTRGVLRGMLRARAGRIINVSSVVGLHGNVGQANYAASKAALVGMTKALAREVGKRGITVNAVAPGFIATAMVEAIDADLSAIPAGRLGEPDEVAAGIAFLASNAASYVNGSVLQIDGGLFA